MDWHFNPVLKYPSATDGDQETTDASNDDSGNRESSQSQTNEIHDESTDTDED